MRREDRTADFGVGGGKNVAIPPRSRGRDSLAIAFLTVDLMSSDVPAGIIPRPGVVPLIGEPCRAGVVPRETTMLLPGQTNDASSEAREPNSV